MVVFHVVLTDNKGHILAEAEIQATNLLDAGIIAESICDYYYEKHPNNEYKICSIKDNNY